ncbi:MAG: transporter substrate-binding domain-containing protein [Pseudomonadota bacterium]
MASARPTIVVGGDSNYPPYEYLDKNAKPAGYNVELTHAIAEVMGMQVDIRLGPWDDKVEALKRGDVDVLQGIVVSEERKRRFAFSSPHATIHHSVFARKGTIEPDGLQGLSNKEVMVRNQSIMHDYLLENQVNAIIFPVTAHVDALRLLSAGKRDYALVANLPGLYFGQEFGLSNIVLVGKPFTSQRYAYGVLRGNEALVAEFNEGLAILQNTGRQQAIYDKWLGALEQETSSPWQQLGMWAMVASVLLLIVTGVVSIWNITLKSRVDKRTSELKDHQQQLIQADKMASLGVLVSGVAHEINNPTGLLLLNLPLMNDTWRDSQVILEKHYREQGDFALAGLNYSRLRDEIPVILEEMKGGADRIKRIVEDLKDFARHDVVDTDCLLDINAVVQTAIRLVDTTIRKSTRQFVVSYGRSLPPIQINAQRIEQVLINLILNACQALTNPDQKVEVTTAYNKAQDIILITVSDQGCGIEKQHLTRLTDPFFTTKREHGGTGLGLSVSAGIVKAHGGKLLFSSIKDEGTQISLELPVSQTTDAQMKQEDHNR